MNVNRVLAKQMIDTVNPPSAAVAREFREKWEITGYGVYVGGPYCAPNGWSRELVDEYVRLAGVTGFAPIHVGQQAGPDFGPWTPEKQASGARDGAQAVALTRAYGWSDRRYVFLDVESETVDAAGEGLRKYVADWCEAVNREGLWPGVYCPPRFVADLVGTSCAYIWISAWIAEQITDVHPDSVPGVDPRLWPRHRLWQYAGNAELEGWSVDLSAYNHWLDGAPA